MKLNTSAVLYLLGMADLSLADSKFGNFTPTPFTMQPVGGHETCSRSVDRLLKRNVDFNDVLAANTGDWVDESFNFPEAYFWPDMHLPKMHD